MYRVDAASTLEERADAFGLVYKVYRGVGYGTSHRSGLWYSMYELLPQTITVVVRDQADAVVAAVSIVQDSPIGLPADAIYKHKLDTWRAQGRQMSEVISLGVRDDIRGSAIMMTSLVNYVCLIGLRLQGSSHFVITVVPRHLKFYCHSMMFEQASAIGFHEKTGVRCVLLTQDLEAYDRASEEPEPACPALRYRVPSRDKEQFVERLGRQIRPLNPDELATFLETRPQILEKADSEARAYLERLAYASPSMPGTAGSETDRCAFLSPFPPRVQEESMTRSVQVPDFSLGCGAFGGSWISAHAR